MADYACTVTLDLPKAKKIGRGLHILSGKVDITNYNSALAEITAITGKLRTIYNVICDSMSESGYVPRWDRTEKSIKCFNPRSAQAADVTDRVTITASGAANITDGQSCDVNAAFRSAVDAAAGDEVADDVDVGEINFIAYGVR